MSVDRSRDDGELRAEKKRKDVEDLLVEAGRGHYLARKAEEAGEKHLAQQYWEYAASFRKKAGEVLISESYTVD